MIILFVCVNVFMHICVTSACMVTTEAKEGLGTWEVIDNCGVDTKVCQTLCLLETWSWLLVNNHFTSFRIMYVCVCTCVYVSMHEGACVCVHVYVSVHECACVCAHVLTFADVPVC